MKFEDYTRRPVPAKAFKWGATLKHFDFLRDYLVQFTPDSNSELAKEINWDDASEFMSFDLDTGMIKVFHPVCGRLNAFKNEMIFFDNNNQIYSMRDDLFHATYCQDGQILKRTEYDYYMIKSEFEFSCGSRIAASCPFLMGADNSLDMALDHQIARIKETQRDLGDAVDYVVKDFYKVDEFIFSQWGKQFPDTVTIGVNNVN